MIRTRNRTGALLAVVALAALLAAPVPAPAQTVSPFDYDVPVSTSEQARLGVTFNYAGQGTDVQTCDGSANILARRFYNSLPFAYDVTLNGVGATRRTPADKQKNSYNAIVEAGVRKYFSPEGDFFYSVDGRLTADNDFDRPAIEATPGAGYGRFITVTTLAKAVRIEDFLLKENVIKGRLSKATMIELAQLIERQNEFQSEYGERYKVQWFEAMEEVIARAGMFTHEGLGAAGSLRMDEVLFQERINERFIGWDARAGLRLEVLNPYKNIDREDPSFSGRLRYSRPVGWESQFDANVQYVTPFTGDFGVNVYTLTATLNYLYELSNRIDFTASNIFTARRFDPDLQTQLNEQVRAGFLFYLENQVNLNITAQASKIRGQDIGQGLYLGLEYRLR